MCPSGWRDVSRGPGGARRSECRPSARRSAARRSTSCPQAGRASCPDGARDARSAAAPSSGRPEDVLCQVEALRMAFAKGLASIGDGARRRAPTPIFSEARKPCRRAPRELGHGHDVPVLRRRGRQRLFLYLLELRGLRLGLVPEGCGFSLEIKIVAGTFCAARGHHRIVSAATSPRS